MLNVWDQVAVVVTCALLVFSVASKIVDSDQMYVWAAKNYPLLRKRAAFDRLFGLVVAMELVLVVVELEMGSRNAVWSVTLSLSLWLLALWYVNSAKDVACPCFGKFSVYAGLDSTDVARKCFIIDVVCLMCSKGVPLYGYNVAYSVVLAIALVACLFVGRRLSEAIYIGRRVRKYVDIDIARLLWRDGTSSSAIVFVAVDCPVCMSLLKYLERFTKHFPEACCFNFVIEGMPCDEDMVFGGGRMISVDATFYRDQFGIKNTPSMVLIDGSDRFIRYVGLDACSLAASKIALS